MKVYVVTYRHLVYGANSLSIFDSYEKALAHVRANGYTRDMGSYDARMHSFVADNGLDVADIFEMPVL